MTKEQFDACLEHSYKDCKKCLLIECPYNLVDDDEEEKVYKITPYGCLYAVCMDYGIDISHLTQKVAEHFYEDFMEQLCKCGYVDRKEVEE